MNASFLSDQGMEMGGVSSRRASELGEQLTLEGAAEAPPQRRRRKKKSPTIGDVKSPLKSGV